MREIKFRAWDNLEERMYNNVEGGIYQDPDEIVPFDKILGFASYDVMQYTGLKDKNGTEIYEGDIIKCDYFKGVVEFRENAGIYVIGNKELEKCITFFDIHMSKGKVEVKGNIHENPELLERRE